MYKMSKSPYFTGFFLMLNFYDTKMILFILPWHYSFDIDFSTLWVIQGAFKVGLKPAYKY